MSRILFAAAAACMVLLPGCGSSGGSRDASDTTVVLATVGDVEITMETLRRELELIPPYQRASFETPEGQRVLLDHLVERELLLQAAEDAGLASDSFVQAQVEQAMQQVEFTRQRALIQAYYENEVVEKVTVPDSAVTAYYEEHKDDLYYQTAQVRCSMILTMEESSMDAAIAALQAGTPFAEAAALYSEHEPTKDLGGDIGWVSAGAALPYLGGQDSISAALFAAAAGDLAGPFETSLGTVLLQVTEYVPEGSRPLEEVRESIVNILKPAMVNTYFRDQIIPGLRESYGVSINEEAFMPGPDVPADSLMRLAQGMMESDPERAISYFQLFLQRFPEDSTAYQAQFLIGFTYSEYLHDYDSARDAFDVMIQRFPGSELTDDAEWMLQNMETPIDSLIPAEGEGPNG